MTHPHVAYYAFTHGLIGKWTYFLRTLPNISDLLQPLETTILKEFIPAIAGKSISNLERDLFSLPVRMGGLGLCDPSSVADFEFEASVSITSPLIQEIIQQRKKFSAAVLGDQLQAKVDVVSSRHQQQASCLSEIMSLLPDDLRRNVQLSSEKGASSMLSVLPIEENGFALHKDAFRDALCMFAVWLVVKWPSC